MQAGSRPEDENVRVEDYLNDKLQNTADLDTLDALIASVREHQELLKDQLADAQTAHSEVVTKVDERLTSLEQQAHHFYDGQRDIDRRLLIVTQSDTDDDAVRRFEASTEKLRRLDVADGYLKLLRDVDNLSKESASQLKLSATAALGTYGRLQKLVGTLRPLHLAAEGAAPHVLDHVERTVENVRRQIKDAFSLDLEKVLAKIEWPKADASVPDDLEREWNDTVGKLLHLQRPELEQIVRGQTSVTAWSRAREPTVLLPLEVMVQPLEMRFRYHFEGDRPTNRPEKPEYFLSHVSDLIVTYSPFFAVYLQPILLDHFRGTDMALYPAFIDATSAFISALLPMLRTKIYSTLKQVSGQPQLLSHIMHEIMEFDRTLREDWGYDGVYGMDGWRGLTWDILVTKDWFGRWFQVEKDFALSRYQSIINAPDSGELDFDGVEPSSTKPTKAAIRVNDLLESVTDRYRLLPSFSQKLRFLMDIQIAIFDKYHERLHSALEAYLAITSPLAVVQGITREEQVSLQGVAGLERLCRVFGSAEYLEKAMRDWSDDVFFLELWDELQDRIRTRPEANVARHVSLEQIAERTSSAVTSGATGGALFDETASAYNRLRVRTEGIMLDTLVYNLRDALRPYGRINPWSSLSHDYGKSGSAAISAELDQAIQQLSSYLSFLAKCLATAPLRRICRQLLLSIQTYLWDHILARNTFSSAGSVQFATDVSTIVRVVDASLGEGYGEQCLRKLVEAVRLLALPVRGGTDEEGAALGLWSVEKRLFADNDSARAVLEELGLHNLTESEARHVIERRVELGS